QGDEHLLHGLAVGDVDLGGVARHARATERGERLVGFAGVLLARVVERDRGAGTRERFGRRPPDATRAARHQHAVTGERHAAPPRTTAAATWPLAHTSSTSAAAPRGASASAASRPSGPAAPKVSPSTSFGCATGGRLAPSVRSSARRSSAASAGGA